MSSILGNHWKVVDLRAINVRFLLWYLTIIPQARMGSESIAHEAEGRMGY